MASVIVDRALRFAAARPASSVTVRFAVNAVGHRVATGRAGAGIGAGSADASVCTAAKLGSIARSIAPARTMAVTPSFRNGSA
jgi:hypothetical protein